MSSDKAEFSMPEFKCSYCEYKSNKIQQFELHLKTHKFKKQKFVCSSCNKLFWYAGNLQKHRERKCREIEAQGGPQAFSDQTSPKFGQTKPRPFSGSGFMEQNLIEMLVHSPSSQTTQKLTTASVHQAEVSISQPAGQTLLDFLNSSRTPEKYKYEGYTQSLKELKTLQQSLEQFNTDDPALAAPIAQPHILLELFKNDPLPTLTEETTANLQITGQNLLGSSSVQTLALLNADPTPQHAAQTAPEETETVTKKKKHSWECVDCAVGFKDEAMYIIHRLIHVEKNPFKCALCGKKFYDRYSFTSHIYLQGHQEANV